MVVSLPGLAQDRLSKLNPETGKKVQTPEWIGVDWGTSNLRLWGLGRSGAIVFSDMSDQGMGRLSPNDYPEVISALLAPHLPVDCTNIPVMVCGMAGARQGWREAPYLDVPTRLDRIGAGAVDPGMPGAGLRVRILPGVCQREAGREDVMRGEETQILGFLDSRPGFVGIICLPGTHSKWVEVSDGQIVRFATAMTGELFALLSAQSVLRHALNGMQSGPNMDDGLDAGLFDGLGTPDCLSSHLFRTRAAGLLSGRTPDWCAGYLSGVLIGAEIAGYRAWRATTPVVLIGSAALCARYATALARDGAASETVDATAATLAGLAAGRRQTDFSN